MKNVVVVGSQWGDEGKGKIVDWLSSEADVVVRFQGGHNAGHTLVIDKKVFKLRLLPSGIVRKGKISILGNGVVIDPWALLREIEEIKKQGVKVTSENFMISESASLILPFHQEMDEIREDAAGKGKIGTTRRGIGPCYEDTVGRRSIRVMDLRSESNLDNRLENVLLHHNAIRKGLNKKIYEKDKLKSYKTYDRLRDGAENKGQFTAAINAEVAKGKMAGYFVDRKEVTHLGLEGLSREQLEKRLDELEEKIGEAKHIIDVTPGSTIKD